MNKYILTSQNEFISEIIMLSDKIGFKKTNLSDKDTRLWEKHHAYD